MTITETRTTLSQRRAALQKELASVEEAIDARDALEQPQRLAEELHSLFCHLPHEDMCGWYYDSWDNYMKNSNSSRHRWIEKADKLLTLLPDRDEAAIVEVAQALKGL